MWTLQDPEASICICDSDGSDIIQWINYERCTLTEFYPAIAIANLVAMLQDEALSNLHKEIVEALLRIFGSLGAKSGQYVNQVRAIWPCKGSLNRLLCR